MATAKSTTTKKPKSRAAATKSAARKSAPVRAKAPAKKATASKSTARRPVSRTTVARKAPTRSTAKKPARATKVDRIAPTKTTAHRSKAATKRKTASRAQRKEISHIDRVWELAERIGICMFITWDGERQRARPLAAHIDRKEHAIDFLTDVDGHKDEQVAKFPTVSLAFSDGKKNRYVAITGKAEISNDRDRIKALWNPWAKAWWD